jgi:hypothetical protein
MLEGTKKSYRIGMADSQDDAFAHGAERLSPSLKLDKRCHFALRGVVGSTSRCNLKR